MIFLLFLLVHQPAETVMTPVEYAQELRTYVKDGRLTYKEAVELYTMYLDDMHPEDLNKREEEVDPDWDLDNYECSPFIEFYVLQPNCIDRYCFSAIGMNVGFYCYPDDHMSFGIMLLAYQSLIRSRIDNYVNSFPREWCKQEIRMRAEAKLASIITNTKAAFDVCSLEQPPDEDELDDTPPIIEGPNDDDGMLDP